MLPRLRYRVYAVGIGIDVLINAATGGDAYTTISCRVGLSIENGGWASRINWPQWWVDHCKRAVFQETV